MIVNKNIVYLKAKKKNECLLKKIIMLHIQQLTFNVLIYRASNINNQVVFLLCTTNTLKTLLNA